MWATIHINSTLPFWLTGTFLKMKGMWELVSVFILGTKSIAKHWSACSIKEPVIEMVCMINLHDTYIYIYFHQSPLKCRHRWLFEQNLSLPLCNTILLLWPKVENYVKISLSILHLGQQVSIHEPTAVCMQRKMKNVCIKKTNSNTLTMLLFFSIG